MKKSESFVHRRLNDHAVHWYFLDTKETGSKLQTRKCITHKRKRKRETTLARVRESKRRERERESAKVRYKMQE